MSSDSSDSGDNTKVYKLRSKKRFPIWKQKIVSAASSRGFEQFLLKDAAVKTQDELDMIETEYINETDDVKRRKLKGELSKYKRERKRSLAAADLITSNVRDKDLKQLAKCKLNPKAMFDVLSGKYENNEDEDIDDLLDDFKKCKLKSKKKDPEVWYTELDEINEQLEEIDNDFKKSKKEMTAHILANLPKRGYKTLKEMIKMEDNYLDDVAKVKRLVSKHWKSKYRKKNGRYDSSSSESDSDYSSDSSDDERSKRKKKKDLYALNINDAKADTRNEYGIIICGHCKKPGHGIANCWLLHGRPSNFNGRGAGGARQPRRCWICNSTEHLANNCPKKGENNDNNDENEQINNLFIGAMWNSKKSYKRIKSRLNAYDVMNRHNGNCVFITKTETVETKSEMSWCNVENDVSSMEDSSFDSSTWCKMCTESSDDSSKDNGNTSTKRNIEKEIELKTILGMNKATEKEQEQEPSKIEYNCTISKDSIIKGIEDLIEKNNELKEIGNIKENNKYRDCNENTIMVITCFNNESSDEEEGDEDRNTKNNDENTGNAENPSVKVDDEDDELINEGIDKVKATKVNKEDIDDTNFMGLGVARKPENNNNEKDDDKLDHSDFYYNEKGVKMVRKIATESEATDLIAKYHGDKHEEEGDSKAFKIWKDEQMKQGVEFTPLPWDDNYGNYDEDTDDSVEMKKRIAKRELFSKDPLKQLFHRYVPIDDENEEIVNPKLNSKKEDGSTTIKQSDDKSEKTNDPNTTETQTSRVRYIGPNYSRDPYETDTDQSVGESSSDVSNEHTRYFQNRLQNMSRAEFLGFANYMANENDLDSDKSISSSEQINDDEPIRATQNETKEDEINVYQEDDERNENDTDEDVESDYDESKSNRDEIHMIYDGAVNVMTDEDDKWETWLGDSGASCHVTYDDSCLTNGVNGENDRVVVGDSRRCMVTKKGDLQMKSMNDNCVGLANVRIVKEIEKNIISIGRLLKDGWILKGSGNKMVLTTADSKLTFNKNQADGLYYTKLKRTNCTNLNQCNQITNLDDKEEKNNDWKRVEPRDKKKWPKLSREVAHAIWGHPHLNQLNKMGTFYKVNLTGKLPSCAGCGVVKSRAMATTKTCSKIALKNGERVFIDTTGPYPKSRGGMKYWMVAVDDRSDKTWTYFTTAKKHMIKFVKEIVTLINGLGLKVKYLRCDNAGEHQKELIEYCNETGITLEYTAPNSPKQNGRAEKKIHVLWTKAMTMMVHANLTPESQGKFWAEAVSCSNWLEDLTIKAGRAEPALFSWTHVSIHKWLKALVQFGRLGIVNKRTKLNSKMKEKGYPAMMVGYAHNHGPGTYKMYNPQTNRIVMSRDVKWMDFKPKLIESSFDIFEPGVESVGDKYIQSWENEDIDNSSISSHESEASIEILDERSVSVGENQSESSSSNTLPVVTRNKKTNYIEIPSSSSSSTSSKVSQSSSSSNSTSSSSSSSKTSKVTRRSKSSKISKPRARKKTKAKSSLKVNNNRASRVPVPTISVSKRITRSQTKPITTRSAAKKTSSEPIKTSKRGKKIVTGDQRVRQVHIFTDQDEGEEEDNDVNLVSEYDSESESSNTEYIYSISEDTINRLYQGVQSDERTYSQINTMELMNDPNTPKTIKQALSSKDKDLWRRSAIAEVNNFLNRKSWKFILKTVVEALGRKLIGVKWVFKIKSEPDYSLRYKSRVVSKGYMQIPGVDYTEKFSPVAQASSVRMILALVLWFYWKCELVDVEAAFLEGKLKQPAYIALPPGLVELGFMSQEQYDKSCIELQGGMYGNVDAALLYFIRFTTFATAEDGLGLEQSKSDPCLFFKRDANDKTIGIIIIYVDDCLITGEDDFIENMKNKLKQEFGIVEDGQLRKLLGIRYNWEYCDDSERSKVVLSMNDKAEEIIQTYEKLTGLTAKEYKTPGKPGELLEKHEGDPVMHNQYRSILGKLMFYVTKVSPECSFSCGQLARQMHNPGPQHWNAMNRMIGYLKFKKKHELVIKRPKSLKIMSFGDASYCDCKDTRRSSTGDLHTLGGSIVSWRAQKTKSICLSTAESEYIALTEMCKEQKFLSMLLDEVFNVRELPSILYEDNEAAVYLAKNKHVTARTKHIDIKQHYVREHLQNGLGTIVGIKSEDNFADILTKNVSLSVFDKLSAGLLNGFEGHDDKFQFSKYQRENI